MRGGLQNGVQKNRPKGPGRSHDRTGRPNGATRDKYKSRDTQDGTVVGRLINASDGMGPRAVKIWERGTGARVFSAGDWKEAETTMENPTCRRDRKMEDFGSDDRKTGGAEREESRPSERAGEWRWEGRRDDGIRRERGAGTDGLLWWWWRIVDGRQPRDLSNRGNEEFSRVEDGGRVNAAQVKARHERLEIQDKLID